MLHVAHLKGWTISHILLYSKRIVYGMSKQLRSAEEITKHREHPPLSYYQK